jgi:RNA polymerase sigma-70 factor (ECF subfamily)
VVEAPDSRLNPEPDTVSSLKRDRLLANLLENRSRFLSFLSRRVGNSEVAEEILQKAFVRSYQKSQDLRDDERVTGWFYRILRNAVVDHYRKRATERRAIEGFAREPFVSTDEDSSLHQAACECVHDLVKALKPEYSEILQRLDLDEGDLVEVSKQLGITANNAGVRLHRARKALRQRLVDFCGACTEHGCLNCTCGAGGPRQSGAAL